MLQHVTHIAELIHLFLMARDKYIPQCGFDDIEGAGIPFLEMVLLAELPPALHKQVAASFACESMHKPRFSTICS